VIQLSHFVGDEGRCGLNIDEHQYVDGRLVCPDWLVNDVPDSVRADL